jgi:uncharacterized protein YlxW (UPF0749 family)
MEKMKNFSERLKFLMESKGFRSIREFAMKGLGHSGNQKVDKYLRGTKPSFDDVVNLAEKFPQDFFWLISGKHIVDKYVLEEPFENFKKKLDAREQEIEKLKEKNKELEDFRKLQSENIEFLKKEIESLKSLVTEDSEIKKRSAS